VRIAPLALALVLAAATTFVRPGASDAQSAPSPSPSPAPTFHPFPTARDAVTHHAIVLNGRRIPYTARAGTILLDDANGQPAASMFYVAYTADGAPSRSRPVTFFWNGGPGSSTIWLHMGSFAPVRIEIPANGAAPPPNPPLVDNPSSLLDTSDLVFVDAVGTGWSTVVGRGKTSEYYGADEDAKAFAHFIERWLTRNGRWDSPKFLFGESYGTTRAANVANRLVDDGVALSGVVLLSSALDYNFLPLDQGPGEDYPYVAFLPSEAAVAWYHRRVPGNPPDLVRFLAQVRAFAGGRYAEALRRGDALDPATRRAIVAQIHAYTGLDERYIDAANLRIDPNRFRAELLRTEGRNVGRYDGRYSGFDLDPNAAYPGYDPSYATTASAFVTVFNRYARAVLRYGENRPYDVLDLDVNRAWKYQRGDNPNALSVVGDLKAAMTKNPYLHVLSANGYFDLATSFYGTEYLLEHMALPTNLRAHLHFAYFQSGHEVYLNRDALVQFKRDLLTFYRQAGVRVSARP
jgi:carboxypeptidase C (cathepsin A)